YNMQRMNEGMCQSFALMFLAAFFAIAIIGAIHGKPDRPAPKTDAPPPVLDLNGQWEIGSKYMIEHRGKIFEITGESWRGFGRIENDNSIIIEWARDGQPAWGLYRIDRKSTRL